MEASLPVKPRARLRPSRTSFSKSMLVPSKPPHPSDPAESPFSPCSPVTCLCPFSWNPGYGHHPAHHMVPMMHAPPRPQPSPGQLMPMQGPPPVYGYSPPVAVQVDPAAGLGTPIAVAGPSHPSGMLLPPGPIVTQPTRQQTPMQQHATMQPHPHMSPGPVHQMMPNQVMGAGGMPMYQGTHTWRHNAPQRE